MSRRFFKDFKKAILCRPLRKINRALIKINIKAGLRFEILLFSLLNSENEELYFESESDLNITDRLNASLKTRRDFLSVEGGKGEGILIIK